MPAVAGFPLEAADRPSFAALVRVFTTLGFLGFGGPAGQIAMMHKMLVDERRWIGEERFLHALNYCMLLPGPEAQQLATYIGWLLHRKRGGLAAGLLFVLPGAAVMLALSALYVAFRHVPLIDAAFFGIKAAVLAIVVEAMLRIGGRALLDRTALAIAVAAFLAIFVLAVPFPLIVLGAGLFGWLRQRRVPAAVGAAPPSGKVAPAGVVDAMFARGELGHAEPSRARALKTLAVGLPLWLAPVAVLWLFLGGEATFTTIGRFFSLMATVTFGGAYAVLAYVAQAAVENLQWLSAAEMLDGLGLAETTPGPLVLVLQFVGFLAAFHHPGSLPPLLAGALGSLLTLWVTFAPCFLWIFLGGPYVEALRQNRSIAAALSAITAAVVGIIANLALWFALHLLFRDLQPLAFLGNFGPDLPVLTSLDLRAAFLSALSAVFLFRLRLGMFATLALSAAFGIASMGWAG
ncbi:chromate transporter [Aureimonas sp. SA4125]|uniref:chromate efflux transporter n=1 Tax=Aureimonas sp. SA4125 TaxID=2826993 RepID=UPI001CC5F13F|nr:chromate transporter [Aureimonas sp. SA4125]